MNNVQILSLVRSVLKIVGTLLVAHGASKVGNALTTEPVIEMVAGLASVIYGIWASQQKASQIPVVAVPTGNTTPDGNTEFVVRKANATVTASNPSPQNVVAVKPETVQSSPTQPK